MNASLMSQGLLAQVPSKTVDWLLSDDNPAVAMLTRQQLLGEGDSAVVRELDARRNEYPPVAAVLDAQKADGSWEVPSRDYKKYEGSLWQVHFLGELMADGSYERVKRGADYAFSRQLDDGSWSCSNMARRGSITCLTANVGRALARMGWARDERVIAALRYCVEMSRKAGAVNCELASQGWQLNGYCHMLTPKVLMFLAEVPQELWPDGAEWLRDQCVDALRSKQVFRCLPAEYREYGEAAATVPASQRAEFRETFLAEHPELHYGPKPGWLRFGFPLSYNSDALEALWALAQIGEPWREEYEDALELVRAAANPQWQWLLQTTFNGKMLADVEAKGKPSKWLTLRALQVLEHFSATRSA